MEYIKIFKDNFLQLLRKNAAQKFYDFTGYALVYSKGILYIIDVFYVYVYISICMQRFT